MSEEIVFPEHEQPAESLSWFQTWKLAITRPSVATFEKIARDPGASTRRAFKWVFFAACIAYVLLLTIQAVLYIVTGVLSDAGLGAVGIELGVGFAGLLVGLICVPVVIAPIVVLFFIISTAIIQWMAKLLGGQGAYSSLVYAAAAVSAPVMLISALATLIPIKLIQDHAYVLTIFSVVLQVLVVKAVHRLGWVRTIVANFTPTFLRCFYRGHLVRELNSSIRYTQCVLR
jgi:hypothetical protein